MLVACLTVNTFKAKLIVKIHLEIGHNLMDLCKVWGYVDGDPPDTPTDNFSFL